MADCPSAGRVASPRRRRGTTAWEPASGGAGRGRPEDDDLVGLVSARLLAAGTPRQERLRALSLLGLLSDHADAGGRVRVPLDVLVGEFDLPQAGALEALEALMRVGAVRRGADGIVLAGCRPPLSSSLRLSAFLANVAVVLDDEHTGPAPAPAAPARSPVLLAHAPAGLPAGEGGRRRRVRPRQPALAALALTGVVLLAALSPSDPPTGLRTVASPPPTASDASTVPRAGDPGLSEPVAPTPLASQRPPAGDQPAAGRSQSPVKAGVEAAEAEAASSAPAGTARRSSDRRPAVTGTDRTTGTPSRQDPVPLPSASPDPPPAVPGPPGAAPGPTQHCPVRGPQIVVDDVTVRRTGPDVVLGVPNSSVTEVRGMLINATTRATAMIRSFEVVIRYGPDTVAMPGPAVTLGPGERHPFTLRASGATDPATTPTVEAATILDWAWQETDVARACSN